MRKAPPAALAAGALVLLVAGGIAWRALADRRFEKKVAGCRALAHALDKTVRHKSLRVFEGIIESRWDAAAGRCYASLEYHYKPCDKAQKAKTPLICEGPDADVAVYAFREGGAKPVYLCERVYAPAAAACTETIYADDGTALSTREVPPEEFPRLKDALLKGEPKS